MDHAELLERSPAGDGDAASAIWEEHMRGAMDALAALGASTRIDLLEPPG